MKFEEINYDTLKAKYNNSEAPQEDIEAKSSVDKVVPKDDEPKTAAEPAQPEAVAPQDEKVISDTADSAQPDASEAQKPQVDAPAESTEPTQVVEPAQPDAALESKGKSTAVDAERAKIIKMLGDQDAAISVMSQRLSALTNAFVKIQQVPAQVDELSKSAARQEKANVDILRDSKNFQATVREQMQKELEGYRKLHAETAYAPILTEIANLYISTQKIIEFVSDEKLKEQLTEMLLENIEEILVDNGVVIHTTLEGQKRSLKTCKTRRTIPTANKELHGLVAASNNPSFELKNLVLIKESVDTYVYDESLDDKASDGEMTNAAESPVEMPVEESGVGSDDTVVSSEETM